MSILVLEREKRNGGPSRPACCLLRWTFVRPANRRIMFFLPFDEEDLRAGKVLTGDRIMRRG